MDANKLREKIVENGYSIPKIANKIGIGKKAFYEKLCGKRQFKQKEISSLKRFLFLSSEDIMSIFFADTVSYKKQ